MKGSLLILLLVQSVVAVSQTVPAIQGWKQQEQDGRYIFSPATLLNTHFTYEVMPPEKNTGVALEDFLDKTAEQTIQSAGYIASAVEPQRREVNSIRIYGKVVKDKLGKPWNLLLMAYLNSNNSIRYGRITYPGSPNNNYVNTAAKHFAALAKKEGAMEPGGNESASRNTESGTGTKQKETTTRKKVTTPVTAPGQGLKPSAIKGVVINAETGIGVGGMVIMEYRPYLLLQNGTIYRYPTVAPYDLDVAASKTAEPNRWGTWKQEGKVLVVTLPEKGVMKTERWDDNWFWAKSPVPNEKIKGEYMTIGGGGNTAMGGNTMVVYSSNINFNEKGQFTMKKMGGGSNTDFDVSSSAYSNSNFAGSYKLNGYSIEMRYNNGQVVRKLFYFYPDSRTTFGIGDDAYVPD